MLVFLTLLRMEQVIPYGKEVILQLTRKRTGEEKVGELVECVKTDWRSDLENSKAQFVIIGIPEDIGVRANHGRAGAATAFRPALDSFLNQQNNVFLDAASIFVLGEVAVSDLMERANGADNKT